MSDAEKATIEINGSRDDARGFMTGAQKRLYSAAQEVAKLHEKRPKDVSYRRASAHLAMAMSSLELARIELRKRKKTSSTPRMEAPIGGDDQKANIPT
jgi:hypothetical protein